MKKKGEVERKNREKKWLEEGTKKKKKKLKGRSVGFGSVKKKEKRKK